LGKKKKIIIKILLTLINPPIRKMTLKMKLHLKSLPLTRGMLIGELLGLIMGKIGAQPGDIIKIIGTKNTVAVVWPAYPEDEGLGIIRMDGTIRKNAGVGLGDEVTVRKTEVKEAKKVVLTPTEPIKFGQDFVDWLHSRLVGRPVVRGDYIRIGVLGQELIFVVTETTPSGVVKITESTEFIITQSLLPRNVSPNETNYAELQKYVDLFLILYLGRIPLGLKTPATGILFYSEPNSENEKFFLNKVLEDRKDHVHYINARKFVGYAPEEVITLLGNTFKTAIQNAPAIIVTDSIHLLAPRRDIAGEFEKRILYKLLALLEEVREAEQVVVLSTTDSLELIDPEVLRVFDEIIQLPPLGATERFKVLKKHIQGVPTDVDLIEISKKTEGYNSKDLRKLVIKAIINAAKRMGLQEVQHRRNVLVTMEDFEEALREANNAKEKRK